MRVVTGEFDLRPATRGSTSTRSARRSSPARSTTPSTTTRKSRWTRSTPRPRSGATSPARRRSPPTYTVTNPGNTPLRNVRSPTTSAARWAGAHGGPNVGDTDRRRAASDLGESGSSPAPARSQTSRTPDRRHQRRQHRHGHRHRPHRDVVTDTATDDVDVFSPAIKLTKLVNGAGGGHGPRRRRGDLHLRGRPTPATHRSAPCHLVDDTPPCERPRAERRPRATATPSWTSARPGPTPAPRRRPTAAVHQHRDRHRHAAEPLARQPALPGPQPAGHRRWTRRGRRGRPRHRADQGRRPDGRLVRRGPRPPEPVTYTYTADQHRATRRSTDPAPRRRSRHQGPGLGRDSPRTPPGARAPPTYDGGDDNANGLLDPGETWQFTCPGDRRRAHRQSRRHRRPALDDRRSPLGVDPVQDLAVAVVDVVRPGDRGHQDRARDPSCSTPTPTPSAGRTSRRRGRREYLYEVEQHRQRPARLTRIPPVDDICAPL